MEHRNYISVEHTYEEADGCVVTEQVYAHRGAYTRVIDPSGREILNELPMAWEIAQTYIYDREDIAGLRKLLDAIEACMEAEGN